jgi:hypothetical protein
MNKTQGPDELIDNEKYMNLFREMSQAYILLAEQLQCHKQVREEVRAATNLNNEEILSSGRIIKDEVIDAVKLVEDLSKVVLSINHKITKNDKFYKESFNRLGRLTGSNIRQSFDLNRA